jgi:hypothetical protein
MNHEFHSYGQHLPASRDALQRLREAIAWARGETSLPPVHACTECDTWRSPAQ